MNTVFSNNEITLADIIAALSAKLQRDGASVERSLAEATAAVNAKLTAADHANTPDYEQAFQTKTTELVMGHIDRMNDVCEEDTADAIVASFTTAFDPILEIYFDAKFPQRAADLAALALRREASLAASDTNAPGAGRSGLGAPLRRRTRS